MPRDPLVPVARAVVDLAEARDAIAEAQHEARALVRQARDRERQARAELHRRIVEAGRAGVRQVDLVRATGLTREAVRRILRAGGVDG